jgi:hypothetical protein
LKWSKENLKLDALKYLTRKEWEIGSPSAYYTAVKNKLIDECCGHMIIKKLPKGHWLIKQNCLNEALKYNTITEWDNASQSSANSARRHNWFEECTVHMRKSKLKQKLVDFKNSRNAQ